VKPSTLARSICGLQLSGDPAGPIVDVAKGTAVVARAAAQAKKKIAGAVPIVSLNGTAEVMMISGMNSLDSDGASPIRGGRTPNQAQRSPPREARALPNRTHAEQPDWALGKFTFMPV
jgi:hypothetical protein